MNQISFLRTYHLNESYREIKGNAKEILGKYIDYPGLYEFNELKKTVTFKSERLIPINFTGRPRVMLLFSNPHPHSVHQGMFLSPNTRGRVNPFWATVKDSGWMAFSTDIQNPHQLANMCFNVEYDGPFEFAFYTYFAFPTCYPNEISKIFGREYFARVIKKEAKDEFISILQETKIKAVVTFNKEIFNLISNTKIDKYINQLINGELIQSRIRGIDKSIPAFLTYPTGWRFRKDIRRLKKESLDLIGFTIRKNMEIQ